VRQAATLRTGGCNPAHRRRQPCAPGLQPYTYMHMHMPRDMHAHGACACACGMCMWHVHVHVRRAATLQVKPAWGLCYDAAKMAGAALAAQLRARGSGARPTSLLGVSLGARVVWYCLELLAALPAAEAAGLVQARLFGPPMYCMHVHAHSTYLHMHMHMHTCMCMCMLHAHAHVMHNMHMHMHIAHVTCHMSHAHAHAHAHAHVHVHVHVH